MVGKIEREGQREGDRERQRWITAPVLLEVSYRGKLPPPPCGTSSRTPIPLGWWFRVQHPGSLRSASFTHEIGKYHAYPVYHPTWLWLNMNGDVFIFLVIYVDKEHFPNRVYDKQMANGRWCFFSFFASFDSQRVYHIFVACFPHMKLIV